VCWFSQVLLFTSTPKFVGVKVRGAKRLQLVSHHAFFGRLGG
jgi:hypothetical protein